MSIRLPSQDLTKNFSGVPERTRIKPPRIYHHPRYPEIEEALMLGKSTPEIIRTFSTPSHPVLANALENCRRKLVKVRMEVLHRRRIEIGERLLDVIAEELQDGLGQARRLEGAVGIEARTMVLDRALKFQDLVVRSESQHIEAELKREGMAQQMSMAKQGLVAGAGGSGPVFNVNLGASIATPRRPAMTIEVPVDGAIDRPVVGGSAEPVVPVEAEAGAGARAWAGAVEVDEDDDEDDEPLERIVD